MNLIQYLNPVKYMSPIRAGIIGTFALAAVACSSVPQQAAPTPTMAPVSVPVPAISAPFSERKKTAEGADIYYMPTPEKPAPVRPQAYAIFYEEPVLVDRNCLINEQIKLNAAIQKVDAAIQIHGIFREPDRIINWQIQGKSRENMSAEALDTVEGGLQRIVGQCRP